MPSTTTSKPLIDSPEKPQTYDSLEAWHTEGVRRFGTDELLWRFVCPACGHVASVAFSCVGRFLKGSREAFGGKGPGPCNYSGGGLFGLNPVSIKGRVNRVFAFAEVA